MLSYYKKLSDFKRMSIVLVEKGYPLVVAIANHELFRNLAPQDQYMKNEDKIDSVDPVVNITLVIDNLLRLLKLYEESIHAYPTLKQENLKSNISSIGEIETRTAAVYGSLWAKFNEETMIKEPLELLKMQFSGEVDFGLIKDKKVLDMGCGSGRYTIALANAGAKEVIGVDLGGEAIKSAENLVKRKGLTNISFKVGNFLELGFPDDTFDFVYCNGVLHHSKFIEMGISEIYRVLKDKGSSWVFLYGSGGIFWNTRNAVREIMQHIPIEYTNMVMDVHGLPGNLFSFVDCAYVPIETHSKKEEVEELFRRYGFSFRKVYSKRPYDLEVALSKNIPNKHIMWGEGAHRYLLQKMQ